jgi:Ferritin-like
MTSRSTLLKLLTEACELEHGLACSYLYSAMTLKTRPDARLPAEQAPMVRQWASQLYFIASQEMLHLAQAWNLLSALGGTPYYLRPNFPQNTKYYPLHLKLALEPYGEAALDRFVAYEKPLELMAEHRFVQDAARPRAADGDAFRTIGELYESIENDIAALPAAIVGDPAAQVGPDLVDFPDLVKVTDVASARRAIRSITHQGEGNATDRIDCHFGIFMALRDALLRAKLVNPTFEPAHRTLPNPTTDASEDYGAPHGSLIGNAYSRDVAAAFDALYSLMLRMLGYTWSSGGSVDVRRAFGQGAIIVMATVLKPLGEALTQLPASNDRGGLNAGPAFGLTRHVQLSPDERAARVLVSERLVELTATLGALAASPQAPPGIQRVAASLERIAHSI